MKKVTTVFLAFIILLTSTACSSELYEHMIIKGFGIDIVDDGYKVTVRYASLEEENKEEVITVIGETVYDAMNKISLTSGKTPLYSAATYIIYGKDVAINGLDTSLDFFIRYFKAKPTINLFIADGSAQDILSATKGEDLISSSLIENTVNNEENLGKTVSATVMSFVSGIKSESNSSVVPIITYENEEFSCKTSAFFQDYSLVGILNEEETKGYLASIGELKYVSIVIGNTDKISLEIQSIKSNVSCEIENNQCVFYMDIVVEVSLSAVPLFYGDIDFSYIEYEVSKELEELIYLATKKTKETNVDYYGIGNVLYLNNYSFWQENSDSFLQELSELEININVKTNVIRTGEEDTNL